MPVTALQKDDKKESRLLTVKIVYHEHTERFFLCFLDDQGNEHISVKLSECEAVGVARELGLKVIC